VSATAGRLQSVEMAVRMVRRGEIMSFVTTPTSAADTAWLTMPELVEVLGEPLGRVRRLLDESHLIGSKRHGAFAVPAVFIDGGRPLASLRGTIIVLHDAGFTDDEAIDWMLAHDDTIGTAPIEALRAGRKSEVRRVAQTLA
jgi:hypothetical protein